LNKEDEVKHPETTRETGISRSRHAFRILVVDDELGMRELLEFMLKREGYDVVVAENGQCAVSLIARNNFDLLLCDIRLGDISGLEVLRAAKKKHTETVAIMISAYSTTEEAVEAMNEGAYDFVPKPFDNEELKEAVSCALQLKTEAALFHASEDHIEESHLHFGLMVGNSPVMLHIYDKIRQMADTRTNVLITGESGTGKELIARALHEQSRRKDEPFVGVNCGGIPETLMESEFFGHKKGSFTGAVQDKGGFFQIADQGTLFLDEVGELPLPLQVKLLRAIQERRIRPVGGTEDIAVNVRIISATNKDLAREVIHGRFREDLYYRLNVIEIKVPSLRERKNDLRVLAQHFIEKYAREMGKDVPKISSYAVQLMKHYNFPGNIRELENLIERTVALSNTKIILPENLSLSIHKNRWIEGIKGRRYDLDEVAAGVALDSILAGIERAYLEKALECSDGNKQKAADLLGISFRSFRYRVKKLGIE
jgi:two-component system response regulator PilR (NtrC family)